MMKANARVEIRHSSRPVGKNCASPKFLTSATRVQNDDSPSATCVRMRPASDAAEGE